MNKQTRTGKIVQTDSDDRPKARRRRLVDSIRDVMTILASATMVTQAHAADVAGTYSSGPYLQLSKRDDVTTEKGYYESTGQGSMYSAIRVTGPNAKIHIFDSTLVGLYWHTHALYGRKGGVVDAHDSTFRAEALDGSAVFSEGALFDIERSKVETLGSGGHGVYVRGRSSQLRFAGGEIITRKWGSNAGRAEDGATLVFDEAFEKKRTRTGDLAQAVNETIPDTDPVAVAGTADPRGRVLRTRLTTEGGESPAILVQRDSMAEGRSADLETRGANSPAVLIDHDSRGDFWSSTFKVAAANTPIVSMKDGAHFGLRSSIIDTGQREVPVIEAQGGRQSILLSEGAQLVGRTVLSLKSLGDTPGALSFLIADKAAVFGEVRADSQSRLKIQLINGGRFEGRVTGQMDFDIGLDGEVFLLESIRLESMRMAGRMQFARGVAAAQTVRVKGTLHGDTGRLVLRTVANGGGPLAAQKTDRLLVEGDMTGALMLDVVTTGTGGLTDTNVDGVVQASEGISLVQVAGKAAATSFSLIGSYMAVGPYRYELTAFAPGESDKAQRAVAGEGDFWDFRLASFGPPPPVPEPVVVEPPPPPIPEPVVVEPPPPPIPEPVVVEPPPPPVPEPVIVEPPPPPIPEPVVVEPPPPPVPEPVIVEPPPPPIPEPVVVEPPPPPLPEPVVVEPPPPPIPEPVVVEPPPPPIPEPVVVEPPPPPIPEPVVVEPPPPPIPEPVVVEPPPPPIPEPVVVEPPPPPVPEPVVVEPPPPVPEPVVVEPWPVPEPEVSEPAPVPQPEPTAPQPQPPAKPATATPAAPAKTNLSAGSVHDRTPPRPVLVPQASAYVAMPLAASGFLREALHAWGHPHSKPAGQAHQVSGENGRGFAHVFGSRGRYEASGQEKAYRPDFSTRQYGAQFGLPVHRYRTANGTTQVDLGAGVGDAGFAIHAPLSQSQTRMRIAGLGLRIAHTHYNGAYATGLLKIDYLGIDVRTPERGEVASFGGIGISALCEAGGVTAFADGWAVESSIRASYVEARLRDFTDADRVSVKPRPFRSASAGIGSRVSRLFSVAGVTVRPYVGAGLAYTSGPPSSQLVGGVPFASETLSSSWEASAGFEGRIGKNARLLVDVAVQDGLDHGFSSVFATGSVQWTF